MKKIFLTFLLIFSLPAFCFAQTFNFGNPLSFDTVEELLENILVNVEGIIVTLAIVFLIIGAILYITSAGNDRRMQAAKGAIFAALIGFAIAIAARSFLREIGSILGWTSTVPGAPLSLGEIAVNVLNFLLGIIGTLAIIMMVIGGIMYLTSAGDEDRMKTGKKIFIYSVIGITVALGSLLVIRQVGYLIRG